MFNWKKKEVNVQLEGCLKQEDDKLCCHKQYKDSCYFCLTGKEPGEVEQTKEQSSFKYLDK